MLNLYVEQLPMSAEINTVFKASRKYLAAGLFFFMTLSFIYMFNGTFKNVQFIYEVNNTRLIHLSMFNVTKKILSLAMTYQPKYKIHITTYRVSPKIRQGLILIFFRKIIPGLILGDVICFHSSKTKLQSRKLQDFQIHKICKPISIYL